MLASLYIENIAVVRRAEIELGGGLTVLTGETGAGKSVIIDSIRLLMGARAQREQIRRGESSATVAGLFRDISQDAATLLRKLALSLTKTENFIFSGPYIRMDEEKRLSVDVRYRCSFSVKSEHR